MKKPFLKPLTVLLILLVLAVYGYQVHYFWHYVNDDAYITFRYSQNLADGLGPYFNAGERVEGYTNFLLMVFISFVIRCFGPATAPFAAKLIGCLCGAGAVFLTFCLFRNLFRPSWKDHPDYRVTAGALAAAGVVAVAPAFALNSTSGLETTLFSFFLILGVFIATADESRKRWIAVSGAFSLALLTRPEASLLFGVFWLTQLFLLLPSITGKKDALSFSSLLRRLYTSRDFRRHMWTALAVVSVFLGQLIFRYFAYDGEWLPNTYYAKHGGFWKASAWPYTSAGLLSPVFGMAGLLISLVGYGLLRRRLSARILPVAILTLTGFSLPFITGTDWMPGWRLVIPFLPFVATLVVGGWLGLFAKMPRISPWTVSLTVVGVIAALWFKQDDNRREFQTYITIRAHGYETGHTALAHWLKTEAKKGDAVAVIDIGIIGCLCPDLFIMDITGLTDRFIAKSAGGFMSKSYDPKYILDRRPEFIVIALSAPGQSYQTPPEDTLFYFWTPMEERIAQSPDFVSQYVRKRKVPASVSSWLDSYACRIGAEAVFEHGHPGCYFLMAVFRRDAPP
jgi:hypothetical protein